MSEEDRLELKKELLVYSKEELIEKYIDELEENSILTNQWYKSTQRIDKAIEYIEKNTEEEKSCLNGIPDYRVFKGDTKELLEILKGEE